MGVLGGGVYVCQRAAGGVVGGVVLLYGDVEVLGEDTEGGGGMIGGYFGFLTVGFEEEMLCPPDVVGGDYPILGGSSGSSCCRRRPRLHGRGRPSGPRKVRCG